MRLAGNQPCVPLGIAGPDPRRVREVCGWLQIRFAATDSVDSRNGAVIGRSQKLDGNYWRRHARQPVEFAKSVQTLSELGCKVLLEIGRNRFSPRRCCGHGPTRPPRRGPSRHCVKTPPTTARSPKPWRTRTHWESARLRRCPAGTRAQARPTHLSVPASPVLVPGKSRNAHPAIPPLGSSSETVRLLEDGRIEELAALLGGTATILKH